MKVLVTGANGFVAQNLIVNLSEREDIEVVKFSRDNSVEELDVLVKDVDFVFHLAGVNRPDSVEEFKAGNADLTRLLCNALLLTNRTIPVIYSSSIQAEQDNPYGKSKLQAEQLLEEYQVRSGADTHIFRLSNVFGKWSRPNYNSVVSTFCYNIANDLEISIHNEEAIVNLVYVDDVIHRFVEVMDGGVGGDIEPVYEVTLAELANKLYKIKESRKSLITEPVGTGFDRALHSTYLSYFSPQQFSYSLPRYSDERGTFVEMLKTKDSGQFSYFTAHPGVTRGGHYHHTKTEKFLVLKGTALYKFRHIVTGETYEITTNAEDALVVETVPGWTHDITNVGDDEMIVMLWANEIFDRENPDTYAKPL